MCVRPVVERLGLAGTLCVRSVERLGLAGAVCEVSC